ncbi:Receptor homology region, transmembrane domain- and RING domain-containing protein 1 [Dichanthelium oligosanthes]|uniref:Receptor homology region, transmembrane domain-and RING domain-containing protein 1 n=1 Tax=Dichanthelium oligosanthes TaxID=888268 RepID=A0A1E5UR96_9POAL|nr:Receptor homology region, transmembrane domain- and RING domain-containing protein 1 [Dichanthelium oligosanthes]
MNRPRGRRSFPLCSFLVICLMAQLGACNVVLMANNTTLSFDDVEATFSECYILLHYNHISQYGSISICPLRTKAVKGSVSRFALVIRGGCQFDDKVRNVQNAGFRAAIVYDNEDNGILVSSLVVSLAEFHAACVDLWLTSWRTFCPVCKRDANAGISNPPVSESTPLLSSAIRLPAESTALASFRLTVAASPPRPISRHPSSQSISRNYSISGSGIPRTPNPHRSYANSPPICTSRSNADIANMSSPWSRTSHLASAHSLCGGHLSPSINIRYTSRHVSCSGYGSPGQYIGSSHMFHGSPSYYPGSSGQQHPYLRHCTLSGPSLFTMVPPSGHSETSLSAAASTQSFRQQYLQHCPDSDTSSQSLPGC